MKEGQSWHTEAKWLQQGKGPGLGSYCGQWVGWQEGSQAYVRVSVV